MKKMPVKMPKLSIVTFDLLTFCSIILVAFQKQQRRDFQPSRNSWRSASRVAKRHLFQIEGPVRDGATRECVKTESLRCVLGYLLMELR